LWLVAVAAAVSTLRQPKAAAAEAREVFFPVPRWHLLARPSLPLEPAARAQVRGEIAEATDRLRQSLACRPLAAAVAVALSLILQVTPVALAAAVAGYWAAHSTAGQGLPVKGTTEEGAKIRAAQTGEPAVAAAGLARLVRSQILVAVMAETDFHLRCLGPQQLTRVVVAAGLEEQAKVALAERAVAVLVPGREPLLLVELLTLAAAAAALEI
jgi:hypothetical protein